MNRRPSDFDPRLAAWLEEGPTSGPEEVLSRTFARARSTRQDRVWLHRLTHPTRSQAMNTLLKVAAVVAVITVGGLAVTRVGPGPGPGTGTLGVEAPSVTEEWAFFTGTITKEGTEDLPALSEPFTENGLSVDLGGWGQAGRPIVTDDPRMTGTQSVRFHDFTDPTDGSAIKAILSTIENDAGAWTCQLIALSVRGGSFSQAGWCEGVGGYEGLRAYIALGRDVPPSDVEVSGFITSADGLPFPEAPTG